MLKSLIICIAINFVCGGQSPNGVQYLASVDSSSISPTIAEDATLDVVGLVTKYGYPVEAHTVQTEDGYLLTAHRISQGKGGHMNKSVVIVMHGLLGSSADWILMGPDSGLGYYLADEGFDVWMGNARGNFYSRKHITLNPERDFNFWKFSWNEIGYYDLPAIIDYVLAITGEVKLHYIGYSQGSTTFFVMAALKPEYNSKIKSMHALAPAAFMANAQSPLLRLVSPIAYTAEVLESLIGLKELLSSSEVVTLVGERACQDGLLFRPVCNSLPFLLCGYNPALFNTTMLPVILGQLPAGASSRQLLHYCQEYMSGKFRKYDHGPMGNLAEYGAVFPPDYNLSDISAPVALHYSDNDWNIEPVDVDRLYRELGNPIGKFRVPNPTFNHMDFMWANNIRSLLYTRVLNLMKSYN